MNFDLSEFSQRLCGRVFTSPPKTSSTVADELKHFEFCKICEVLLVDTNGDDATRPASVKDPKHIQEQPWPLLHVVFFMRR